MDNTTSSVRERIVAAAAALAQIQPWDRVSYSAVAVRAGVSRPTLYAHFPTRDDLYEPVSVAVMTEITARIAAKANRAENPADFVVELLTSLVLELRENPLSSAIALVRPGGMLEPAALELAVAFLEPLVAMEPRLETELEEIAETMTRFMLSFLMFDSERARTADALRSYLRRRLVPALGLSLDT